MHLDFCAEGPRLLADMGDTKVGSHAMTNEMDHHHARS